MKQLLFVLLVLSYFCSTAQNKPLDKSVLLLSKTGASKPTALSLKPNKQIKIKTFDGRKYTFSGYALVGDSAIASSTDTLALRDIASIRGTVRGNVLRKVGGGLVAGVGHYFVAVGYLIGTIGFYPPAYLLILPSAGVAYIGHHLSGPRRFDTSEKWTLNISPKTE